MAHCDGWRMLALHNLGAGAVEVTVRLRDADGLVLHDVLERRDEQSVGRGGRVDVVLEPYEGRWLRVLEPGQEPFA